MILNIKYLKLSTQSPAIKRLPSYVNPSKAHLVNFTLGCEQQSNIPIFIHRNKSKWFLSKYGGPSGQALLVKMATKQSCDLFGQETSPAQFKDNRPLKESIGKYPDPEVIPPQLAHRQTFIMLHGRGSTAET